MAHTDASAENTFAFWRELAGRDPRAAARTLLKRIEALEPAHRRAIVASVPTPDALEQEFAAAGRSGKPLAGIPFVVKDLFAVAGIAIGAGSSFLGSLRGPEPSDSPLVARVRELGGVFAGMTHLHEFAYGLTGENPHFGDAPNPRIPGRLSGGSSSGSAAAVAAGIVPLALGTDTGGSVRVPSAFCGIWGHRGRPETLFQERCFPLAETFDTAGWFTSTREDLVMATRAIYSAPPRTPIGHPLARIPALLLPSEIDPGFAAAMDEAARAIADPLPDDLLRAYLAATADSARAFSIIQSTEAAAIHAAWLDERRGDYDPAVWTRIDRGRRWSEADIATAHDTRNRIRSVFAEILTNFSGLVLPSAPFAALSKSESTDVNRTRILQLTTPASHAGLPALAVPIPQPDGTSGGLQVVSHGECNLLDSI